MEWIKEMGGYFSTIASSVGGLISAATYVLVAISLFTIAKRREIPNPWMAFVPILQMWLLGAISDDYQQKVWGTVKTRRKTLLGLQIAIAAMGFVLAIMVIAAAVALLSAGYTGYDDIWDWIGVNGSFGGIILVLIAWGVLEILAKIWRYVALFDIYRSCKPEQAVLFLLLNIFVAITEPIFLLLVCRSDEGMTPLAGPAEPWEME
jgi:hypothetical protein